MRRVLAWADLTVDGHAVRVYGTHLSAGSGAAAASRAAQIEAVRERIGTEIARGERRIVLAGDMNVAPDGSEYPHLVGSVASPPLLSDAFAAVHPHAADAARCPSIATTDAAGLAALWADPSLAADCGYSAGWPKDDNFLGCDVASWCVSWLDRAAASPSERIDYVLIGPGVGVAAARVPSRADADWALARSRVVPAVRPPSGRRRPVARRLSAPIRRRRGDRSMLSPMTWNLADLFETVVDVVPDREALVIPDALGGRRVFTFAELDERVNRLAHALAERGVKAGDKVGVYGHNGKRVRRGAVGRVEAPGGAGQRQLSLRRGRAAVPLRQRRRRCARARGDLRRPDRGRPAPTAPPS
jgi:endonuclease/exonuclease/phosphatase family metal-dependent hydrolase